MEARPGGPRLPRRGGLPVLARNGRDDREVVDELRNCPTTNRKAKDILRAAALPLLPADNAHVAADLAKVRSGRALSPVLLVRGDLLAGIPMQIADGYHRVCASYHLDENTDIPCRLAGRPAPAAG